MIVATALFKSLYIKQDIPPALPPSLCETVTVDSPVQGSNYENPQDWLKTYNNHILQSTVFLKGPLLSTIPGFSEIVTSACLFCILYQV